MRVSKYALGYVDDALLLMTRVRSTKQHVSEVRTSLYQVKPGNTVTQRLWQCILHVSRELQQLKVYVHAALHSNEGSSGDMPPSCKVQGLQLSFVHESHALRHPYVVIATAVSAACDLIL